MADIQGNQSNFIEKISFSQESISNTTKQISDTQSKINGNFEKLNYIAYQTKELKKDEIKSNIENTDKIVTALNSFSNIIKTPLSTNYETYQTQKFLPLVSLDEQKFILQKNNTNFLNYNETSFYYDNEGVAKDYYSLTFITTPKNTIIYLYSKEGRLIRNFEVNMEKTISLPKNDFSVNITKNGYISKKLVIDLNSNQSGTD